MMGICILHTYIHCLVYLETRYLPGHSFSLHCTISVGFPVQVPPLASSTIFTLVSVRVPVPQLAEQIPLTQAPHLQWIATVIYVINRYYMPNKLLLTRYVDFSKFLSYIHLYKDSHYNPLSP